MYGLRNDIICNDCGGFATVGTASSDTSQPYVSCMNQGCMNWRIEPLKSTQYEKFKRVGESP